MLPFEIPSLSFGHRNKMHLIEMYVKRWGGYNLGKTLSVLIKYTVALVGCSWHRKWSGHLEGDSSAGYAFHVPDGGCGCTA